MKASIHFVVSVLFIIGFKVYAHQNKKHTESRKPHVTKEKLESINNLYSQAIQPIFKNKCLDCHGGPSQFPWYHRLPIAKQLMDDDVREGKKHLDISSGFPFKGHGSPLDDLKAIEKVVKERTMPPMRYWLLHWNCRLTKKERLAIVTWVQQSKKILREGL
ncbi:MAG: heme-binding domain-containing protein [Deltaproteobacteria bacterium]|nr:heme-binding domain-containing protein [Deltaproteobacteria bacterium]